MEKKFYIFLILPLVSCNPVIGQTLQPYLQAPTDTSIRVTWKTDTNTESTVMYGSDPAALTNQVTGDCQVLSDTGYDNNYFYHSVSLAGLAPDQYYWYRVVTGNLQSEVYRFRTQPRTGRNPDIYRILILGDHQIKGSDRYEKLMMAARDKVLEKYGGTIEEHIRLIINDGDQVDQGTLDQYEHVHFRPSSVLSGNIPVMTTVGNHETYGSLGLTAYYQHFFYDGLGYRGIVSPGVENYYSYQEGSVVFVHLSSEHATGDQISWVRQIMDSVKYDESVNWVVGIAHRPIQAEQFVGDISQYIRDQIVPILATSEKSTLLITGHHHLYARGQLRDYPMYHIISGGASWDQFWGQSTEKDFDDVQKTIDYWTYQIASFDDAKGEMIVESYAIGSPKLGMTLNNELIDSFYRRKNGVLPDKPSIVPIPADSVSLPFTVESSAYSTVSSEPLNSTQFQVSPHSDFSKNSIDLIRDYENLFGTTGSPDYRPVDIHKNVNILTYTIGWNKLPNGTYYVRVRHRDRNLGWSDWSDPSMLTVKGSISGFTRISTTKTVYEPGEDIIVSYESGPGNAKDWIGIYKRGDTPGNTPSTDWEYTTGSSGTVSIQVPEPGRYFIGFFENDGYDEIAERIELYINRIPVLTLDKAGFATGESLQVTYSHAPGLANDWIGIYKLDDVPGVVGSTQWEYTSGAEGVLTFSGLTVGYYYVSYFLEDQYTEACERVIFSVGSNLATVTVDKASYLVGQPVRVSFENGPGTPMDWMGLFRQNPGPGTAPLVNRMFIAGKRSDSLSFDGVNDPGDYYIALFINNSGIRISNQALFKVESGSASINPESGSGRIIIYPSPSAGRLKLKIPNPQSNDLYLRIMSSTGEMVLERELRSGGTEFSEELDFTASPAGLYMINVRSGNQEYTRKFVISR